MGAGEADAAERNPGGFGSGDGARDAPGGLPEEEEAVRSPRQVGGFVGLADERVERSEETKMRSAGF
jgi:hypothetical protein